MYNMFYNSPATTGYARTQADANKFNNSSGKPSALIFVVKQEGDKMKLVQVINGKIAQYSLPKTGVLKDGSTVSGYHLLDEETLLDEGWLPLEDIPPEYDEEIQYLVQDGYEVFEDKVIKKYRIEEIPEREEHRDLEAEVEELRQIIDMLIGGEDIEQNLGRGRKGRGY